MRSDLRDVIGGAGIGLIGLFVLVRSFGYGIGSVSQMGAGFFPMVLGASAIIVGILVCVPALGRPGPRIEVMLRPMAAVIGGILAFGLAIWWLGLLPAVALTAVICALGDPDSRLFSTLALAACICVGVWLIFSVGLGLPIPLFPRF